MGVPVRHCTLPFELWLSVTAAAPLAGSMLNFVQFRFFHSNPCKLCFTKTRLRSACSRVETWHCLRSAGHRAPYLPWLPLHHPPPGSTWWGTAPACVLGAEHSLGTGPSWCKFPGGDSVSQLSRLSAAHGGKPAVCPPLPAFVSLGHVGPRDCLLT